VEKRAKEERRDAKKSGWKIVVVALLAFLGSYLSSAAIAQVVLTLQGDI